METIMTEHTNPELWKGLPKVEITAAHIDRALKAMKDDTRNLSEFTTRGSIESAILAGGVIAYLEALSHRTMSPHKLYGLAEDLDGIFGVTLRSWAMETYGLIDPEREEHRRQDRENNAKAAERAQKSRIKREANMAAKRAAEIEAEVQRRLAEAA
jgi:hypothetical protein